MDVSTAVGKPALAASRALRSTLLGLLIALVVQATLGAGVNLYITTPESARGDGVFAAFGKAISDGGPALAIHAVLGTLITLGSIAAVVRAVRARRWPAIVACTAGLACLLGAFAAGAAFVGDTKSGSSMTMAVLTGIAMIVYLLAYSSVAVSRD
ncbi:MAG TPA: hypothetical protein VKD66_02360 [Streptosporangiaceae bacterium]|nr:hypothetical protein [Streptosporangiaceae bacterium]